MRNVLDNLRSSLLTKVAIIGAAGIIVAGCSSDVSRFGGGSFFGGSLDNDEITGSIPPTPTQGVASSPLGSPGGQANYGQPTYGQMPVGATQAGASTQTGGSNGSSVVVGQGETVFTIANRYGVPTTALMKVNNITDPNAVPPGTQLVIPVFSQAQNGWVRPDQAAPVRVAGPAPVGAAAPASAAPKPVAQASAAGGVHTVTSGETVYSLARRYGVKPGDIIAANGLQEPYGIKIGQSVRIPGAANVAAAPAQPASQTSGQSSAQASGQTSAPAQPSQTLQAQVQTPPPASAPVQKAGIESSELAAPGTSPSPNTDDDAPQKVAYAAPSDADDAGAGKRAGIPEPAQLSAGNFRWPARGRIISSYGEKNDGGKNDGINISVPEGTSVRAAENGVVAYAGSELKGYGNLVLIRHSDDWVTAYAHNSEIAVQRGDVVTRGQVIAKAGQSGTVSSPQIHFELRKGSTPVDPLKYLAAD